jgi:hypothetical protein
MIPWAPDGFEETRGSRNGKMSDLHLTQYLWKNERFIVIRLTPCTEVFPREDVAAQAKGDVVRPSRL